MGCRAVGRGKECSPRFPGEAPARIQKALSSRISSSHGCVAIARLALYRVRAGFRNRLSEENHHTAEALDQRGSGVLAGRCVL